ncbi:MAG: hypothetical protein R2830_10500 [Saprospiraceae bacterium]
MANLSVASTAPFSDTSKKYTPAAQPLRGTIIVSPGVTAAVELLHRPAPGIQNAERGLSHGPGRAQLEVQVARGGVGVDGKFDFRRYCFYCGVRQVAAGDEAAVLVELEQPLGAPSFLLVEFNGL